MQVVRYVNSNGRDVVLRSVVLDVLRNHYLNLFHKHKQRAEMKGKKRCRRQSAPDTSRGLDLSVRSALDHIKAMDIARDEKEEKAKKAAQESAEKKEKRAVAAAQQAAADLVDAKALLQDGGTLYKAHYVARLPACPPAARTAPRRTTPYRAARGPHRRARPLRPMPSLFCTSPPRRPTHRPSCWRAATARACTRPTRTAPSRSSCGRRRR